MAGPTIRATLVVDGALSGFLGSAAAVLLGADAVGANRWINKAGSLGLAAAAGSVGKPVFVIATRDKFVPPAMEPLLRLPAAPPDEVWGNAPDNVEVANRYFEFIPADLVTFFLTEAGPIPPTDLGPAVSRGNDDISFLINILQ